MCGIVGYIGPRKAVPIILDGLKRLEYRGYDSAGIAVLEDGNCLGVRRASGKLRNLEDALRLNPVEGSYGIGHTRWATHGRPTEENAHPHRDCHGDIVVVHNGIVENYLALKQQLRRGRPPLRHRDRHRSHRAPGREIFRRESGKRRARRRAAVDRRVRAERDLAQGSEQDRGRALRAAGGDRAWATASISWPPTCPRF